MPDREAWEFINSFAPWFSAFGTLCAVWVSLYLARQMSRRRVRVSCSLVLDVPTGHQFFQIYVVNHGFREVVVSGLMWKQRGLLGWREQQYAVFPPDTHSTEVPAKLQPGDQAYFRFLTETFPQGASALLKTFGTAGPSSLTLRRLSAGVYTSTDEEFLSPLDRRIRKWLVEQASQYRAQPRAQE